VASDTTVFQDYTSSYYSVADKEIVKLSLKDGLSSRKLMALTRDQQVQVKKPNGVDHYYVMEMEDQPEAVCRALNYGARFIPGESLVKLGGIDPYEDKLQEVESMLLAACGTSFYAA